MSNNTTVDIIIPDIGDSEDVEIIEILISVGDSVNADDSLLTLESDKASMEVPSASAGVIETLTISVGDIVNAGDVIGTMSASSGSDSAATADSKPDSAPAQAQTAEESKATNDSSTGSDNTAANKQSNAPTAKPSTSSQATSPTAHISDENMRKAHASPGVRRYAREHGADLSLVKGSGPKDRIVKEDVVAFIKQAMEGLGSSYGGASTAPSAIALCRLMDRRCCIKSTATLALR